MNRRGMTIVELLAALVIMTIVASLVAMLIASYRSVHQDITDESKANLESTLLFQSIRNDINAFSPTDYNDCVINDCVILVKTFEYVYLDGSISLNILDPIDTITLEVVDQTILFNNQPYRVEYFSIGQDTTLLYTVTTDTIEIEFNLVLESTENTYYFSMTHSYEIEQIPA
ncbi:MAG: type II secretion system protein [Tenericutes bacterium]|jgi:prepilin-type N-terminal cleavage/methylation domain-containing protein|nr:type II secretion system protein [Mycoplasmatota bacterium]